MERDARKLAPLIVALALLVDMSHASVNKRLNVRNEIKRIRVDPLQKYLDLAYSKREPGGVRDRYEYAYYLYSRAMERVFEQISTAVKYRKGPYYVKRYGGRFTPGQKKLADKARTLRPYMELDISTSLLHTRILLDRVTALSRPFLKGPNLPSFTSFSDHKKFFYRNPNTLKGHEVYSSYIREETNWFDIPIKFVRDKFFVHQGPKHFMLYTIGWENDDNLTLHIQLMPESRKTKAEWIRFNPWRMSYDIENHLRWFAKYAVGKLDEKS